MGEGGRRGMQAASSWPTLETQDFLGASGLQNVPLLLKISNYFLFFLGKFSTTWMDDSLCWIMSKTINNVWNRSLSCGLSNVKTMWKEEKTESSQPDDR